MWPLRAKSGSLAMQQQGLCQCLWLLLPLKAIQKSLSRLPPGTILMSKGCALGRAGPDGQGTGELIPHILCGGTSEGGMPAALGPIPPLGSVGELGLVVRVQENGHQRHESRSTGPAP